MEVEEIRLFNTRVKVSKESSPGDEHKFEKTALFHLLQLQTEINEGGWSRRRRRRKMKAEARGKMKVKTHTSHEALL